MVRRSADRLPLAAIGIDRWWVGPKFAGHRLSWLGLAESYRLVDFAGRDGISCGAGRMPPAWCEFLQVQCRRTGSRRCFITMSGYGSWIQATFACDAVAQSVLVGRWWMAIPGSFRPEVDASTGRRHFAFPMVPVRGAICGRGAVVVVDFVREWTRLQLFRTLDRLQNIGAGGYVDEGRDVVVLSLYRRKLASVRDDQFGDNGCLLLVS